MGAPQPNYWVGLAHPMCPPDPRGLIVCI